MQRCNAKMKIVARKTGPNINHWSKIGIKTCEELSSANYWRYKLHSICYKYLRIKPFAKIQLYMIIHDDAQDFFCFIFSQIILFWMKHLKWNWKIINRKTLGIPVRIKLYKTCAISDYTRHTQDARYKRNQPNEASSNKHDQEQRDSLFLNVKRN